MKKFFIVAAVAIVTALSASATNEKAVEIESASDECRICMQLVFIDESQPWLGMHTISYFLMPGQGCSGPGAFVLSCDDEDPFGPPIK